MTPEPARAAEISAAFLLCLVIVLGGASQGNAAPLALAELLSLPVLTLAIRRTARTWDRHLTLPTLLLGSLFLIPLLQLWPLPPGVWSRLPGRSGEISVMRAIEAPLPGLPISLTPELTLHCVLALIPPAALFLIVRSLDLNRRGRIALVLTALALGSLLLGLAQVASGPASGLRFYRQTDVELAVGFFANRDHFADFLACAIPLSAGALRSLGRPGSRLAALAPRTLLLIIPLLIMGIAATASRAGIVLGVIGLGAALWVSGLGARRAGLLSLGLAAAAAGLIAVAAVTDHLPALARFAETGPDLRFTTIPFVIRAIKTYWPLGSGVGSFIPIYQTVQPTALVDSTFFNHAHDEFLEATLESGVAAWLIFAAFAVWWARRGLAAWRRGAGADAPLAKVGAVVVGMILLHATVDFPFRNIALAGVFALACALMTPVPFRNEG